MSFFSDYALYTARHETPEQYNLWSALAAMSSIISRRVHVKMGHFTVYPNLYVVLVGPPGNRKTTAMNIAKRLIRELKFVPLSADSTTRESLSQILATESPRKWIDSNGNILEYSPLTCFVTEFSEFVGAASAAMVGFLTAIYDEDVFNYRTKNKGNDLVVGPFLVLLGCTTPAWITSRLKDDVISGGFSRRAIFVNAPESDKRVALPYETDEEQAAWRRIIEYSQSLENIGGEFQWSDEGREFFVTWYEGDTSPPTDPNLLGWWRSKSIQVIKIAMLLALGESSKLTLEAGHIAAAIGILGEIEDRLSMVFSGLGRNELKGVSTHLILLLEAAKGVLSEKVARAKMFNECTPQEFQMVVTHLLENGTIVKMQEGNNTGALDPSKPVYLALSSTSSGPRKGSSGPGPSG